MSYLADDDEDVDMDEFFKEFNAIIDQVDKYCTVDNIIPKERIGWFAYLKSFIW